MNALLCCKYYPNVQSAWTSMNLYMKILERQNLLSLLFIGKRSLLKRSKRVTIDQKTVLSVVEQEFTLWCMVHFLSAQLLKRFILAVLCSACNIVLCLH